MTNRIGVDTGGTHTDLVLADDSGATFLTLKVPTTPHDLSEGVLDGTMKILDRAAAPASSVGQFVYGTTLVTNLIVEHARVPVGLITTEGFRDVLHIGRASRKLNIYDIFWHPPEPLVPRHLRMTVPERIDRFGEIVVPLDEMAARAVLRSLADGGVESIAVCFLNAYANPVHERRLAELAKEECPGIGISLSSEVVNEFREYERMSTTTVNAFVSGPMTRHLDDLAATLIRSGVPATPAIMRSNGGLMTFETAKRLPVAITHSGPMGGIIGGNAIAASCGIEDIITLDMGGTSADVSLIANGRPALTTKGKLGDFPVLLPMLDLVTIGAGGGSIGWIDEGKGLRVGPTSAGSIPGPACYDQGGTAPTLTDANLVAGRLNADYFLAGARALRRDLAEKALHDRLAAPVGITVTEAATGILAIAESHMVNAIKLISVQRGLDPREFTLVAFGGSGPLHAAQLAEELAIHRVLIPAAPGNVSAMGMLAADVRHDLVRTHFTDLLAITPQTLAAAFSELLEEGGSVLEAEGTQPGQRTFLCSIDLQYAEQNFELTLPLPGGSMDALDIDDLQARFHEEHQRIYGYKLTDRTVQMVNLRLTAVGTMPAVQWPRFGAGKGAAAPFATREILVGRGEKSEAPVYRVDSLAAGLQIDGPAIVEYPGSTVFVPVDWHATYDDLGNAHLVFDVAD